MHAIGLFVTEAAFFVLTHVFGGPPWTVVAAITFVMLSLGGRRLGGAWGEPVWLMLPSLGWLAAFWATGDRELFFPFTMYLAAHASLTVSQRGLVAASVAGGIIVAAFLVIRLLQEAMPRVLAVEAVAATMILAVACLAITRRDRSLFGDGLILAGASLAAFASLQLPS